MNFEEEHDLALMTTQRLTAEQRCVAAGKALLAAFREAEFL